MRRLRQPCLETAVTNITTGASAEMSAGVDPYTGWCGARASPPPRGVRRPFGPSRFEHEDYSVARRNSAAAAVVSSAIEIACRVLDQTSLGETPVRAACEIVQHRLRARRIHLEHNSLARCAAARSSAIE